MSYQIITLENNIINLYKNDLAKSFKWNNQELIKEIEKDKKLYIIYLEKIMYHKNIFLYTLEKNDIEYEIISKSNMEILKYIYDYWNTENEEVIDVNKVNLFILLDPNNNYFNISIFKLSNSTNKLDIQKVYEDYKYIDNKKVEQYLFLDIIDEIQRVMRKPYLRNIIIAKIILIGKEKDYRWFKELFKDKYSEYLIEELDNDVRDALKVYLDIENENILDPFNKSTIKYFSKEIIINESIKEIDIKRSIQMVNKYERLPIDKNIIISPISSSGEKNIFSIEVDDIIYNKEISFPFIYNFDDLTFNILMDNEENLRINVYINGMIIETWDIDWGKKNEI